MALCYIVDDHIDTREGFAEYLRWQGFDVRTASSANEFRELIAEGLPGAIVMDLVLPGTDGFALTREIKANPRTRAVPVLVVSASVRPQDRESAEQAGSDAFLPKPCDPQVIVSELHRLIRN
jgi:CheY-like chemotaxis protein